MSDEQPKHHYTDHVIEQLLPAREVHLLGGPSGAGKTTWMFQMMEDWIAGRPICNLRSFTSDWMYLSCDRSMDATYRTLDRVAVKLDTKKMVSLIDHHKTFETFNVGALMDSAGKRLPRGGMIFLDGIASLTPAGKINDYDTVKYFLQALERECQRRNITILGSTHATKTKEGERFLNPRQRILGSVAWGGFSDTVILVEPADQEHAENGERTFMGLPRNGSAILMDLAFDAQGRLVEQGSATGFVLDRWLKQMQAGDEFKTCQAKETASSVPPRTVEHWLTRQCQDGKLESPRKGIYRKVNPS